jgi:hypothetical protein
VANGAADLAGIAAEFAARVRRMAWCNDASVDEEYKHRSGIMHPI